MAHAVRAGGDGRLFAGIRSEQAFLLRTYPILIWLILSWVFFGRTADATGEPAVISEEGTLTSAGAPLVLFTGYGPYHLARLKAAGRRRAGDGHLLSPRPASTRGIRSRVPTGFVGSPSYRTPKPCQSGNWPPASRIALEAERPGVVFINGWAGAIPTARFAGASRLGCPLS